MITVHDGDVFDFRSDVINETWEAFCNDTVALQQEFDSWLADEPPWSQLPLLAWPAAAANSAALNAQRTIIYRSWSARAPSKHACFPSVSSQGQQWHCRKQLVHHDAAVVPHQILTHGAAAAKAHSLALECLDVARRRRAGVAQPSDE